MEGFRAVLIHGHAVPFDERPEALVLTYSEFLATKH